MARFRFWRFAFLVTLVYLVAITAASAQTAAPNAPNITFTVSMSRPWTHLLEVEMRARLRDAKPGADVIMPVWTPGSYMVREFARHVQNFAAFDGGGRALEWIKTNKNTWRVNTRGTREFRVNYQVYANELSVRTNELNADHAFWNNAALLMYPDGSLDQPSTLNIVPYGDWKIATSLQAVAGNQKSFRAENFDVLYDSPVEVSNFKQIDFQVRGVPHRIVIDGEGNYDANTLRALVQRIVETEVAIFNDIPYHDYTFFLHLRPNAGGGLEHANSTALGFPRFDFAADDGYRRFASLVAHEFFHLWNVKRIRPDALGPFNYSAENYTRLLWVAEGVTEYYANLMMRRVGLLSERDYLDQLAQKIQTFQQTPGHLLVSPEESSFDAWIKEYRPDENSNNSSISYYDQGELLGMLLDLEIRRRTHGAKSLDDVMRTLYQDFFKKGRNYTPADLQKVCETLSGSSFEEFFARYVRGRDEFPYNQILAGAGLSLQQAGHEIEELRARIPEDVPVRAYLGADLADSGGRLLVTSVRAGAPAYEQGLNANDQIVALDGKRVTNATFLERLAEKRPGDILHLTIFRSDDLRTLDIRLGSRINAAYAIVSRAPVTDEQKQIYQGWIGAPPRR
ncbi:MAG TPA: PDZ domain-containing protein [Pyrinomonadaceae bacterium]